MYSLKKKKTKITFHYAQDLVGHECVEMFSRIVTEILKKLKLFFIDQINYTHIIFYTKLYSDFNTILMDIKI